MPAKEGRNVLSATTKLVFLAMFAALSIVLVMLIHFPIFPSAAFLEYDPADIPILIGTFLFGPWTGLLLTVVASVIQGVTVSAASGPIGILMHIFATGIMVIVCGLIYSRKKTLKRAILSLVCGALAMTVAMLLWNYLITPLYMGVPREVVVGMLLPIILPFNLIKAGVNCLITFFVYKPSASSTSSSRCTSAPNGPRGSSAVWWALARPASLWGWFFATSRYGARGWASAPPTSTTLPLFGCCSFSSALPRCWGPCSPRSPSAAAATAGIPLPRRNNKLKNSKKEEAPWASSFLLRVTHQSVTPGEAVPAGDALGLGEFAGVVLGLGAAVLPEGRGESEGRSTVWSGRPGVGDLPTS